MFKAVDCTSERYEAGGSGEFHLGRAEDLLSKLIEEHAGTVQLIYLDPPFHTGDYFQLKIDGKNVSRPAYTDILSQDAYIAMMRTVLEGCHALLNESGSLYLHVDYRMSAHMRILMDELFGANNLMNEIIWAYKSGGRSTRHYPRKHDTIFFYRKTRKAYFDIQAVGIARGPERRNHMKRFMDMDGRVSYSIRSSGKTYTYYEDTPVYPSDVWADIEHLHQRDPERMGYETQKPEALLKRILLASSKPGDLVMDLFSGSGTTAAVASVLGRNFIVCDSSPYALYALRKRQQSEYNARRLLEQVLPLTFHFPPSVPDAHLDASVSSSNCTLSSYAAKNGTCSLLYCASGTIEQGIFHPFACAYAPVLPISLRAPKGRHVVLHTVDSDGTQTFWAQK